MPVEAISAVGAGGVDAIGGADAISGAGWVGPEFSIEAPQGVTDAPAGAGAGEGFGSVLADQIGALQGTQDHAAAQSQALAAGTAEDVSSVVMAVERAQLSMQLASQLRTKATEAYQEIFRTQV
jgi:flagellar hook-basal body complex protein FliE